MDLTYETLRLMLLDTLGATIGTTEGEEPVSQYTDDILFDGIILAVDAILPWIPNQAYEDITSGSGNTIPVPDDCLMIEAVMDTYTGIVLERAIPQAGMKLPRSYDVSIDGQYRWMEYPRGHINFGITPTSVTLDGSTAERTFRVFYQTRWPKPDDAEDMDFVFTFPQSALAGVLYWAAAHCLVPFSNVSAQIRQFNTRVDSGNPEDNVLENSAKFLRGLFLDEMNRQPKYIGAVR